jgi:dihydrofolate reductase
MANDMGVQKYAVIAAVDADRGYSKDGKIPWHYKEDFDWFKKQTMDHACVMGRTTYEDIVARLGDKAMPSVLPGRDCYVVSTTLDSLPNATVVKSISEVALKLPSDYGDRPVFIIGGHQLFTEGVAMADIVYLTVINDTHGCDKFFPVEYVLKHFPNINKFTAPSCDKLRFMVFKRSA